MIASKNVTSMHDEIDNMFDEPGLKEILKKFSKDHPLIPTDKIIEAIVEFIETTLYETVQEFEFPPENKLKLSLKKQSLLRARCKAESKRKSDLDSKIDLINELNKIVEDSISDKDYGTAQTITKRIKEIETAESEMIETLLLTDSDISSCLDNEDETEIMIKKWEDLAED